MSIFMLIIFISVTTECGSVRLFVLSLYFFKLNLIFERERVHAQGEGGRETKAGSERPDLVTVTGTE